jgi:hypothetical protein
MGDRYMFGAIEARRRAVYEDRRIPLATYMDTERGRERLVWPLPKPVRGRPGRPCVRDREAIERCLRLIERTQGRGKMKHVSYRAHTRVWYTPQTRAWLPSIKHEREVTRRHDYINLHEHVRQWWPICLRAYQAGVHDLL